jgi:hypothetical protein
MHTVREIELAVSRLSPEQLASFRDWFDETVVDIYEACLVVEVSKCVSP